MTKKDLAMLISEDEDLRGTILEDLFQAMASPEKIELDLPKVEEGEKVIDQMTRLERVSCSLELPDLMWRLIRRRLNVQGNNYLGLGIRKGFRIVKLNDLLITLLDDQLMAFLG